MRYYVEGIRTAVAEAEIQYGPQKNIGAEAHVRDSDGKEWYLCLVQLSGILPNWYRTPESCLDEVIDLEKVEDEDRLDELNNTYRLDDISGRYDRVFAQKDADWYPLCRLLVCIVRGEDKDRAAYSAAVTGSYADEADLPASDVEEQYSREHAE